MPENIRSVVVGVVKAASMIISYLDVTVIKCKTYFFCTTKIEGVGRRDEISCDAQATPKDATRNTTF